MLKNKIFRDLFVEEYFTSDIIDSRIKTKKNHVSFPKIPLKLQELSDFAVEIDILHDVSHKNVIKLYDAYHHDSKLWVSQCPQISRRFPINWTTKIESLTCWVVGTRIEISRENSTTRTMKSGLTCNIEGFGLELGAGNSGKLLVYVES